MSLKSLLAEVFENVNGRPNSIKYIESVAPLAILSFCNMII